MRGKKTMKNGIKSLTKYDGRQLFWIQIVRFNVGCLSEKVQSGLCTMEDVAHQNQKLDPFPIRSSHFAKQIPENVPYIHKSNVDGKIN